MVHVQILMFFLTLATVCSTFFSIVDVRLRLKHTCVEICEIMYIFCFFACDKSNDINLNSPQCNELHDLALSPIR